MSVAGALSLLVCMSSGESGMERFVRPLPEAAHSVDGLEFEGLAARHASRKLELRGLRLRCDLAQRAGGRGELVHATRREPVEVRRGELVARAELAQRR